MYTPRYIFRLISAFLSRFKVLLLLSIGLGIAIFFVINYVIPLIDISKQRIGLVGRYTTNNLPSEITSQVGDGLTKTSKSGEVEPNLALSWESPDKGKTWIFKLNTEKVWQDGKKITSKDINYQFSDLQTEKPDANTIVFKLQNQYSAFPSVVSKPIFKKGFLGTGEYKVKKINMIGNFVQNVTLINKNKKQITYKFYPTEERAKLAFKLGEIDFLKGLINIKPFDSWKKVKIENSYDYGEYTAVFLNTKNPKLGDKSIRQALSYAIDKEKLGGERAISPISKNSWAYNSQVKPYMFDQTKAKKTVSDLSTETKNNLNIILSTSSILLPQAEIIAKNWNDIGVKTEVSVYSTIPEDYEALLVIFDIPEDPDQYSIWHSTQDRTNISNLQNPRVDKLLEDGRVEINIDERKQIYFDFQRYLVEEAPAIFLNYPQNFNLSRR